MQLCPAVAPLAADGRAASGATASTSTAAGSNGAPKGPQIVPLPSDGSKGDVHSTRGRAQHEVALVDAVRALEPSISSERAAELILLGAVYCGVDILKGTQIKWARACDMSRDPTSLRVAAGDLVRVHPKPKRYPACHSTDWHAHVVHTDANYVVVNKPAGLPCMRHESNAAEELAACASRGLGLPDLEICHRLDQWTTGIVVLSRNKDANRAFKASLQGLPGAQPVAKTYKALTYRPVPLGRLEHFLCDGPFNEGSAVLRGGNYPPRGPRLVSEQQHKGWKLCSLEVLDCQEAPAAQAWHRRFFPSQTPPPVFYESTIRLFTGRTHQIRAQLCAIGCTLAGDIMYAPLAGLLVGPSGQVEDDATVQLVESCPQLEGHLGLHAWRLEWGPQVFTAEAVPWLG